MPDIKEYKSMITGEMITSRTKHKNHLRQHNCFEVGNEKLERKERTTPGGIKEDLIRNMRRR
jgi:phage/plasmid-associated DNA primase